MAPEPMSSPWAPELSLWIRCRGIVPQRSKPGPRAEPRLDLPDPLAADSEALADRSQAEPGDPEFGYLPLPLRHRFQIEMRNHRCEPRPSLHERSFARAHGQFFAARYPAASAVCALGNATALRGAILP